MHWGSRGAPKTLFINIVEFDAESFVDHRSCPNRGTNVIERGLGLGLFIRILRASYA